MSPTFSSRSSRYTFPPMTAGPPKPAAIGTVQSTFGPSCGHVRKQALLLRGVVSPRSVQRRPVSREDGGDRQRDHDRDELDRILHRYDSQCRAMGECPCTSQSGPSSDDQSTAASEASLAYSSANRARFAHSSRRFRQTSRSRCLYHCRHDDPFSASPSIHATSRDTQRLQSRPGRRADGFARPAAAPGEDTTLATPGALALRRLANRIAAYAPHDGAFPLRLPGTYAVRLSRMTTEAVLRHPGPRAVRRGAGRQGRDAWP